MDCRDLVTVDGLVVGAFTINPRPSTRVMSSDLVSFRLQWLGWECFLLAGLSSTGFGGFLVVHFRNASSRCGNSQSCQLSSVRTILGFQYFFCSFICSFIALRGRPSIVALIFVSNSSLRYENLVIGDTCTSAESISALNWFQNRGQSVCVPLNLVCNYEFRQLCVDWLFQLLFRFF